MGDTVILHSPGLSVDEYRLGERLPSGGWRRQRNTCAIHTPFSEGHLPAQITGEAKGRRMTSSWHLHPSRENPCLIELALLATRLLWMLSSFLRLLSACTAHTREHMISSTTGTLGLTWAGQLLNVGKTLTELRKEHRAKCATKGCLSYLMSKCNLFPLAREQTKGKARRMKLLNLSQPTFRTALSPSNSLPCIPPQIAWTNFFVRFFGSPQITDRIELPVTRSHLALTMAVSRQLRSWTIERL